MKENSIKNERSSIEEDIKIALDKFSDNKDIDSAILIIEKFILGNYILVGGNRGNIVRDSLRYILSDYKKILKENEELKKSKITYEKVRDIQKKNKNIVDNNYIPKQKIKDKIEEINKMIAYEHNDAVIIQLGKQKRVLQKLLESED